MEILLGLRYGVVKNYRYGHVDIETLGKHYQNVEI